MSFLRLLQALLSRFLEEMNRGGQIFLVSVSVREDMECAGEMSRHQDAQAGLAAFSLPATFPLPSSCKQLLKITGWFHDFLLLRVINVLLQI